MSQRLAGTEARMDVPCLQTCRRNVLPLRQRRWSMLTELVSVCRLRHPGLSGRPEFCAAESCEASCKTEWHRHCVANPFAELGLRRCLRVRVKVIAIREALKSCSLVWRQPQKVQTMLHLVSESMLATQWLLKAEKSSVSCLISAG